MQAGPLRRAGRVSSTLRQPFVNLSLAPRMAQRGPEMRVCCNPHRDFGVRGLSLTPEVFVPAPALFLGVGSRSSYSHPLTADASGRFRKKGGGNAPCTPTPPPFTGSVISGGLTRSGRLRPVLTNR